MSASRQKKERQMQAQMGPTQKEIAEAKAAKRSRRHMKIYITIGAVAALLCAALLIWDNGFLQRHLTAYKVGDRSYSVVEVEYYFQNVYSSYSTYASLYDLDTDSSLKSQELYEGYSWYDMILESALDTLTTVSIVAQEAEDAGYTLSEDGQAAVQEEIEEMQETVDLYGTTLGVVLKSYYGDHITPAIYEKILTETELYQEYIDVYEASVEITDEDIDDYYAENSDTLDTFEYDCYLIEVVTTEEDEDGEEVDLSDEEIEENTETAYEQAEEILAALEDGDDDEVADLVEEYDAGDYCDVSYYSSMDFGDWLVDEDREFGECGIVENTDSDDEVIGYFIVRLNNRYLEEYYPVTVRIIEIDAEEDDDDNYDMDTALETAEELLEEWLDGDATEDTFSDLADENSADASSYSGGLHESVTKSTYADVINEWLFDESREYGDYTLIEDDEEDYACFLIYYVEHDDAYYWRTTVDSSLRASAYDEWLEDLTENSYTLSNGMAIGLVG